MPTSVPHPLTASITGNNSLSTGWKLNQILLATVVDAANGNKNLRINGNIYAPLNQITADSGATMRLQVKQLTPFIELALINATKSAQQAQTKPGIILSERILQWSGQNQQANVTSLVRFIQVLNSLPSQALPPATAALLADLYKRIVDPKTLTNASTLKPALLDASLLLTGGAADAKSAQPGNDLNSILLQLVRSLAGANSGAKAAALENQALALYQDVSRGGAGVSMLLARALGEELLRLFNAGRIDPAIDELYERRWLFELPVNFQDRTRSVVIRILEEAPEKKRHSAESCWRAEFEFELPHCGDLKVELAIEDLTVSVVIICTKVSIATMLEKNQNALRETLASYELQLASFSCRRISEPEFYAIRSKGGKLIANVENIPLRSFEMQKNDKEFNPINGIPDFLYCAMASLFSYVFEIENEFD